MAVDDVLINKAAVIERCIKRIHEEYDGNKDSWRENFTVQDSIVLNLQRACEASIDAANYVVKTKKPGVPQTSRDTFDLLSSAGIIPEDQALRMKNMVGFRNLAVHEYQSLNWSIIENIILHNLDDFSVFVRAILKPAV